MYTSYTYGPAYETSWPHSFIRASHATRQSYSTVDRSSGMYTSYTYGLAYEIHYLWILVYCNGDDGAETIAVVNIKSRVNAARKQAWNKLIDGKEWRRLQLSIVKVESTKRQWEVKEIVFYFVVGVA